MSYALYYSPGACSIAAHVVLNRIGCQLELRKVDTRKGENPTESYLRVNPLGRVPVLVTDDGSTVTELIAVLMYLADKHPDHKLLPGNASQRAKCVSWMSYLQSTIHPFFGALWRAQRFADDASAHPAITVTAAKRLRDEFVRIDAALADGKWLLGDEKYLCDYNLFALARWSSAVSDVDRELPNISRFVRHMADERPVADALMEEAIPLFRQAL